MKRISAKVVFNNLENLTVHFQDDCKIIIDEVVYKLSFADGKIHFSNPKDENMKIISVERIETAAIKSFTEHDHGESKCRTCENGKTYCVENGCMDTPCGKVCHH